MATPQNHLRNAPIEEAMIAFDFETASDLAVLRNDFFKAIEHEYPHRHEIENAEIVVNPQEAPKVSPLQIVGSRFISDDGKRVCTINIASFIVSRLKPYENWDALRKEFLRLWEIFCSLADLTTIKVGVRFINKISIPEGDEIYDYINTFPKLADGLPKDTSNIWVRVEMPIQDPAGLLIVTEVQLPAEQPGFVPVVLDHDLQFPVMVEGLSPTDLLERARYLKNQYFFASISERLVREYQ